MQDRRFKKQDYEVSIIPHSDASAFIKEHHYASGTANTSVAAFGLFRIDSDTLLGAALWMPPLPPVGKCIRGKEWKKVLALSRLAIHPCVPTNGASFLLGACVRYFKKEDTRWLSLVTYADEREGHDGTIYRAANWEFDGFTRPVKLWQDPETGRIVSAKKASHTRTKSEMFELGFEELPRSRKLRFKLHLQPYRG